MHEAKINNESLNLESGQDKQQLFWNIPNVSTFITDDNFKLISNKLDICINKTFFKKYIKPIFNTLSPSILIGFGVNYLYTEFTNLKHRDLNTITWGFIFICIGLVLSLLLNKFDKPSEDMVENCINDIKQILENCRQHKNN